MISRLQAALGKVTVPDPAVQTRGRWRAAYYDALHQGHVPAGHKLWWNGRQRGHCVFTLVDEEAEKAAQPPPVPAVEVSETLDRPHRLVRATRKVLGWSQSLVDTRGTPDVIPLYLSRPLADRALRIMHALFSEAENRGYTVETQTDLRHGEADHTLAIMIRGRAFPLVLTGRTTKVPHEPTPQELRQRERNPWTRLPKYDEEFNGRLTLGAPTGSWYQHSYSYSDGARWTLESRLEHLLQDLERLAGEAERREREKELRETEQRRRWYGAVAMAREQQIEEHRATVLTGQIRAWRQAAEIRTFCQAARARAEGAPVATAEADWLEWAEAHAEQLDPLQGRLCTPPDPPAGREVQRELAKSMPTPTRGRSTPTAAGLFLTTGQPTRLRDPDLSNRETTSPCPGRTGRRAYAAMVSGVSMRSQAPRTALWASGWR
ncbi:hypothetical protein [Streptomyces sp. NPDC005423]|uniref:hypothetical protein n=1 Tax=Streptomyces sp. NPDC005423 TaxID=3155343 RepID=UPI0033B43E88